MEVEDKTVYEEFRQATMKLVVAVVEKRVPLRGAAIAAGGALAALLHTGVELQEILYEAMLIDKEAKALRTRH